jgi:hypothetical protein
MARSRMDKLFEWLAVDPFKWMEQQVAKDKRKATMQSWAAPGAEKSSSRGGLIEKQLGNRETQYLWIARMKRMIEEHRRGQDDSE